MTRPLTVEQVRALPVTLDPVTAGRLLGIGRTRVYQLLHEGDFPAPVLRVGSRWRIPTAGLCAVLGLDYPPVTDSPQDTEPVKDDDGETL